MTPLVYAAGVEKSFGVSPALRGVNFTADRGEIVAITGPSGSGKSTLLHCLAGIVRPDAGTIVIADQRLENATEDERSKLRRTDVGILFQFGHLVPELTAIENVAMPLLLTGVARKKAMVAATTWLERFGVADLAGKRPTQMSGGQAQRVAAGRAMVTDPLVLMADEPTGALDTLAGERVMSEVTRVARTHGTTVLLVTHDARIAAYADREVIVRDGLIQGASASSVSGDSWVRS